MGLSSGLLAAPRRLRARWPLWLGGVLVLAGLVLLGYVGWQYYGTDWVSKRKHADVVERLERGWSAGEARIRTDDGVADAIVRIPRFGSGYAVPLLDGTSDAALAAGFGRVEEGAHAGGEGNFAIAGHRVTHGEPLRDMPALEPGDRVVVETREATYTYELTTAGDALKVPFSAGWVLSQEPDNPDEGGVEPPDTDHLLTLVTCAELFHTDDRLVAFGELVDVTPR